jgi:serine/threonine protein kinase
MSSREPAQPKADARPRPAATPGSTFGRYRLLGRIGEGGMAEVYRAMMTGPEGFERELVLKRILPRLSETGDFKTMFIREAKISALLLHPNIVQIYEFGEADGAYFIAMESVQGVTLREALTTLRREQRAMPHLVAADIARQICIGLDYAHTLNGPDGVPLEIVHQDISPTNIMLAYTGTVKILDFGIARAASFAEEEAKKGLIKGKVSYLSPEQIHVRPFDARADVFALGVVFHEMLTGRRLFQAKNDIARMRAMLAQAITPPSAINAAIPRELDRIVMRALEIDVKARYQSTAEMASDLERTLIAARYSSRELSKLLHGLFLPDEDPLVVVDAEDGHTLAVTGSTTNTTSGNSGQTGSRTSGGSGSGRSASGSGSGQRHKTATATQVDPSPPEAAAPIPVARVPGSGAERLERVVRAERGRLARRRFRERARGFAIAAVVLAVVGAGVWAGKRYLPALLASPPPPPPPPAALPLPNQVTPAPAPPPRSGTAKKHGSHGHKKAAAEASGAQPAPAGSSDEPPP